MSRVIHWAPLPGPARPPGMWQWLSQPGQVTPSFTCLHWEPKPTGRVRCPREMHFALLKKMGYNPNAQSYSPVFDAKILPHSDVG